MIRFMPRVIALAVLATVATQAASAQDDAKTRARIEALERELADIARELGELRAKLGLHEAPPKSAELLQTLDRSYETLVADALDRELLVKAAQAFAKGDAGAALELLRRSRQLAAVPLIVKDMVLREARPMFNKDDGAGHLLALAILTGEDVETHFAKAGSAHRLAASWWLPNRDKFVTNIGKMSEAQLAHVARRLRDSAAAPEAYKSNGPSYYANALLYKFGNYREDNPDQRGSPAWFAEELHPALGRVFLDGMGYRPKGAGGDDILEVPYQLVYHLAAMRRNGALPQLDKIADDATQNSGLRLVCLIALHCAGEDVRVPAVVSILAREKKLDRKLAALEFLHYADDIAPAADYLLEALDDPNVEVRSSVLNALRRTHPPRLFKRLKEMVDAKHDENFLEVIAAGGSLQAQEYLADYLGKTMKDRANPGRIHDALWAFQHSVNQSWLTAGRYTFDYYHERATQALRWWQENGGAKK